MKQILKAMFTSPQTLDISQYLEGLYKMNDELAGADPGFSIGGGTNPLGGPTYDFAKFSRQLHEIEESLGHRGEGTCWGTPLDLPVLGKVVF